MNEYSFRPENLRYKNQRHFSCFLFCCFLTRLFLLKSDLLPDDGERDWPTDEFPGDYPRLLVGRYPGEAATGSDGPDLAQILPLPVRLHDLPVPAVRWHSTSSLHR